jgi:hypothetical protein
MPIGPPSRTLVSELSIAVLVYVGALSASVIVALCLSAAVVAILPGNGEGGLFLQSAISNCVGFLLNPTIFAAVVSNHCRRVSPYLIVLTLIPWLMQFILFRRGNLIVSGEPVAALVCALAGLALAYWVLRRKGRSFRAGTNAAA